MMECQLTEAYVVFFSMYVRTYVCMYVCMSQAMVLALKELSIRGDIRTTVEYISGNLSTYLPT